MKSSPSAEGRQTKEGFAKWPADLVVRWLSKNGNVQTLLAIMEHGCESGSDYSGLAGEIECLHQLKAGLLEVLKCRSVDLQFRHTSFCDNGAVQQDVLLWAATEICGGDCCLFADMGDKLPAAIASWLDAAMPREKAPPCEAAAAYNQMSAYLMAERAVAFHDDVTAPCLTHGRRCRVHPISRRSPAEDQPLKRMRQGDSEVPTESNDKVLRIKFGGTICRGWSSSGGQLRFADPSERLHGSFVAERRRRAEVHGEDVFFAECVRNYPSQVKLQEPLQDSHEVFSVNVNPIDYGWPVRRPRVFSAGVNKETMVWIGSADPAAEFKEIFQTDLTCDGGVFLFADVAEVHADLSRRCALRGNFSVPSLESIQFFTSMPPGMVMRYRAHDEIRRAAIDEFDGDPSEMAWFGDLHQWPGSGVSTPGTLIPTQLTQGDLFVWRGETKRFVMPCEILQAHGYNVCDTISHFPSVLKPKLLTLKRSDLQLLCGNGWHLPLMSSWVLYILSNVRRRKLASIQPEKTILVASQSAQGHDVEEKDVTEA